MLLIALGMACTEPAADGEAFTLNIDVQLASNQPTLLDELTDLELVVEYATGPETYPLSTTEPGRSAEVIGVEALDAETVALVGYSGGEVAAFGRSAALSVSKNALDATIVLLRTNDFAWLDTPSPIAFAAAASTGDGAFWVSGGSDANNVLNNDTGSGTVDSMWGVSLADGGALAISALDTTLPPLADEFNNDGYTTVAGRLGHTMTPLDDGSLLIAGGAVAPASGLATSVEAYRWAPGEPASAPATMTRGRAEHRAELLPSGDAVLVGGHGFTGSTNTLTFSEDYDFYDAASQSFVAQGELLSAGAIGLSTTVLEAEGVLACGGFNLQGDSTGIYGDFTDGCDIIGLSGGIEEGVALPTGIAFAELTTLIDGSVLLTGGIDLAAGTLVDLNEREQFSASRKAYLYVGGSWSAVADMANPRARHAAALLPDGRVLVAGGTTAFVDLLDFDDATALACAEIYDPLADTWTEIGGSCDVDTVSGVLPAATWAPAVAADDDYGVLMVGGIGSDGRPTAGAALFVGAPRL